MDNKIDKTMKHFMKYLKLEKKHLIIITIMIIISTVLSVIAPFLISLVIDKMVIGTLMKDISYLLICLICIYLITFFISLFANKMLAKLSEDTVYRIRKDLFEHMQKLPISFFDKHDKGDIISRYTNDLSLIGDVLTDTLTEFVSSIISFIGVTIMMLYMNVILSLVVIISVPFFFVLVFRISKKTNELYQSQQKQLGDLTTYIEEELSGIKVSKSFNKEGEIIQKFETMNNKYLDCSVKAETTSNLVIPVNLAVSNLSNIVLIIVGIILILNNSSTIGNLVAFLTYASMFRNPIQSMASLLASIQESLAGAERVFEIIEMKPEVNDGKYKIKQRYSQVIFDNVNFGYTNQLVLKNLSFCAKEGDTVAIVGPTGAGKTTIINLLTRFYEVTTGDILINDMNIQKLPKEDLRKHIGIVLQDTYLFKGTIFENICYGNKRASKKMVIEASKKARAHNFIHRLPNGYETTITDGGSNLSQGERQLISIARMILINPDILILDEATSNIDSETESLIQIGMQELMNGKTCFIIAHRLKTIEQADKILYINNGRIEEEGSHRQLLKEKGKYYQLYISQYE